MKNFENLTDTRDEHIVLLETQLMIAKRAVDLAERSRVRVWMLIVPLIIGLCAGAALAREWGRYVDV
jgi:hypothetical protein